MSHRIPVFLLKVLQDLRASYWFVPATMAFLALVAATVCIQLDMHGATGWLPDQIIITDPSAARSVLGVIASASVGSAGVMFSMTMVAVSFASSNFGPRLIGNFMQDRGVQFSLGMLLTSFVFSLTVLLAVRDGQGGTAYVPALSLTVALALVFLSVAVMIFFIHHIPEIISLENVAAQLGHRLMRVIRSLPEADRLPGRRDAFDGPVQPLCLDRVGYIQALDSGKLQRLADKKNWDIRLLKRPGDFLRPGVAVAEIAIDTALSDADLTKLQSCFAIGDGRTETQNPMFLAQQLVEIISRALSPGVNDPVSAMNCLNWLHSALHLMNQQGHADGTVSMETATAPAAEISFTGLLRLTHTDPRVYIADDVLVTRHALSLLLDLHLALPAGPRRDVVEQEYRDLLAMARGTAPSDTELTPWPDDPAEALTPSGGAHAVKS